MHDEINGRLDLNLDSCVAGLDQVMNEVKISFIIASCNYVSTRDFSIFFDQSSV